MWVSRTCCLHCLSILQWFVPCSCLKRLCNTLSSAGVARVVMGWERKALKDTCNGESVDISLYCLHPDSKCFIRLCALASLGQSSLAAANSKTAQQTGHNGSWQYCMFVYSLAGGRNNKGMKHQLVSPRTTCCAHECSTFEDEWALVHLHAHTCMIPQIWGIYSIRR